MATRFDPNGLPPPLKWLEWVRRHWRKRPVMALAVVAITVASVGIPLVRIMRVAQSSPIAPPKLTSVDPLPVRVHGSCYSSGRSTAAPDIDLRLQGGSALVLARFYYLASNGRDLTPIGTVNIWPCEASAPTCIATVDTGGKVFSANLDPTSKSDEAGAIYARLQEQVAGDPIKIVSIGPGTDSCSDGGGYGVEFPFIKLTISRAP